MAYPLLPLSLLFFFLLAQGNPELRALMVLKSSLDPEGHYLSSWTSRGDPCRGNFEGVACNEHGKVTNISLQGKGLSGFISPAVKELRCLSGLYLHYNALRGEIPKEIANLTELTDLYLNVNGLTGGIPSEIGKMASLEVLQLCYNRLTGSIPTQLGALSKLSVLALQSNQLTGAIPASLGDLPQLLRLDLSFNRLFGSIPRKLAQLPQLSVLDVRNNSLSGYVPSDLQRLSKGFQFSNNKGLCGVGFSSLQACTSADFFNPNRPEPYGGPDASAGLLPKEIPQSADFSQNCNFSHCSNKSKSSAITIIVVVIVVSIGVVILGLFVFVWYRRQKQRIGSSLELSDSRLSTDQAKEVLRKRVSPLINLENTNGNGWDPLADGGSSNGFSQEVQSFRFNLEEVECATQYFSEVNLLGKTNFVSTYKGMLRDGSLVAVKSITKTSCKTEEAEFLKGLKMLTLLRHENLVGLKGFCCSRVRGECFLLYDFVANGSLSNYLDAKDDEKERILDWSTRVSIIKGIAKGIEYLHSSRANKPALVHKSISADKILIDQNFVPKLSAVGLHKLLADDVIFSTLKASAAMGYLAPEYTTTGRFTEKSDVYSFGVIVFQILTGKTKVTHLRLTADSGQLDELIDGKLNKCFSITEAAKIAGIALMCTSEIPGHRPTMEAVLQELGSN
ncbi:LOW QUALITY PROTEIN: LRR receptor-like serine/threonine-protein kinase GSO2 [Phalaenopsis equestris]|uniref:LOW QUALITY PROTEIN: LRR receptor-like serine/threonine-protein kinase GSO2 n=1 Tax=Phalaenopsis equestris TaxID=78828 RepID=UPI0009E3FA6C|nr:LOW QUALITY PROTEIN: LRR receptor-like serine/threonine-protein kinase GSO2 [Phalaenopsis equestris]